MVGYLYANELKDFDQARQAYSDFVDLYPDHEMAKDAQWEMENLGRDINDIEELSTATEDTLTK